MAAADLPCDGDGACMRCKATPPLAEVLSCRTCSTPWHATCLSTPLESLAAAADWQCPDCSSPPEDNPPPASGGGGGGGPSSELVAAIRAIEADKTLTEKEKAKRRQALMGGAAGGTATEEVEEEEKKGKGNDVLELLGENFNCSICKTLPERPVTTPCGHNFCLKCFQKWVGQGRRICANCRATIPSKVASQPRINSALVVAIRMAKSAKSVTSGATTVVHYTRNEDRPDKAFTTERAKRAGKANACSGQIFVTVPPDHFGPIPAENDPKNNRGVLVGDSWDDRLDCRQWGVHLPHVAGIAGQSYYGAQSVALSGGYQDDEDHGEWFLYTGSGGRDLSGNKRTNKVQSSDQTFEKYNQALRVSCVKGYPVRVVRSFKEKRSSYAPEKGVRYDGIYRIEKCWRKVGVQGYLVCRYLFVRCDNEPAPWTSDEHGDRPRPLRDVKELKKAIDVTERKGSPSWDYDEGKGWTWMKPRPASRKSCRIGDPAEQKKTQKARRLGQGTAIRDRLLKEFSCRICKNVMISPLTTPCGHNFCKSCLLGSYADQASTRERTTAGGRTLRAKKIIKKCVSCPTDISDFLQNPQVNRELMGLIESLQRQEEEENAAVAVEGNEADGSDDAEEDISGEEESDDAEVDGLDDEVSAGVDGKKDEADGIKVEKKPDSPHSLERKKVAVPRAGNKGRKEKSNVGGSADESKVNSEMAQGVEKHDGDAVKAGKRGRTKTDGNAAKKAGKRGRTKTDGNAAMKARKNMKVASVVADDDGNASPSSPLLVDDDDFQ